VSQSNASTENANNANEAAKNSLGLLGLRAQQERRAAAATVFQQDLEARRADAATRVAAGEAGVAGASVDALIADIERQRLAAEAGVKANTEATLDQLAQERKVVRTNRNAQISAVPQPSPWATGIRIGGQVLETATSYAQLRHKGTK
jgi:hypothetical protein